jgi:GTP 3',8-cyclase
VGAAGSNDRLRAVLRGGASDAELAATITAIWTARADRASELRAEAGLSGPRVETSYLGG